ncbi:MAG: YfhO family protein [Candidatus Omnitrophica bacterium]|nr:YfhO family protein [Candidatus Omnitrophota bacterium]
MNYYRHLILIIPIIKIFLCFLAGFGLEYLCEQSRQRKCSYQNYVLIGAVTIMAGVFLGLVYLACHPGFAAYAVNRIIVGGLPYLTYTKDLIAPRMVFAMVFSSLCFTWTMLLLYFKRTKNLRYLYSLAVFILVLQLVDLSAYRFAEINFRTFPLEGAVKEVTQFTPMPFRANRTAQLSKDNSRYKFIEGLKFPLAMYWSTHSFIFEDQAGNDYRTDHWLMPLDNLMRAYWSQPIHDLSIQPAGLVNYPGPRSKLEFPLAHTAAQKMSGISEQKIQFFSKVYGSQDDDTIIQHLTDPGYKGDTIFLSHLAPMNGPDMRSLNSRLDVPYEVTSFDANHVKIDIKTRVHGPMWLFYSDVWHPAWKAAVDGKERAVFKANLAYKAVKIEPGETKVHFFFIPPLLKLSQCIINLNSLAWVLFVLGFMLKVLWPARIYKIAFLSMVVFNILPGPNAYADYYDTDLTREQTQIRQIEEQQKEEEKGYKYDSLQRDKELIFKQLEVITGEE